MHTPDREIARKLKEYDPALFIEWSSRHQWFELWRRMENGKRVMVTPVTRSIYDTSLPREYVQLDERLLWWVYDADSWRNGGSKKHALMADTRWLEWQKKLDRKRFRDLYDKAKDAWTLANSFYTTKPAAKNGLPKFNNHRPTTNWIAPDVSARTSPRLLSRSKQNALAYNFKRTG